MARTRIASSAAVSGLYRLLGPALRLLPPEAAHGAALCALASGLVPERSRPHDPALGIRLFGLDFASPIGLAAGFDKDARALGALTRQGFGFIEVGGVTPRAQAGNPRPRLFRLAHERAIINRMGLNSAGMEALARRFARLRAHGPVPVPVGINLAPNKDSADPAADYERLIERFFGLADYATLNVSSPNTPGLRALQERERLLPLLERAVAARERAARRRGGALPLLVKIAPDLVPEALEGTVGAALQGGLDGMIVGNTTTGRPPTLVSRARTQAGGLSGKPLFALSTAVLRDCARMAGGKLPLIGVGGVDSGAAAYAKIRAGASLVQLYTALVYEGPGLIERIESELRALLEKDGFTTLAAAIGADLR